MRRVWAQQPERSARYGATLNRPRGGLVGRRAHASSVRDVVAHEGESLPAELSAEMGQRIGFDFSQVRIHRDDRASASAATLRARAYTVGNHVVFGRGQFAPRTPRGRRLLAHELVHVVQQGGVLTGLPPSLEVSAPGGVAEREASRLADGVATAGTAAAPLVPASPRVSVPSATMVQRELIEFDGRTFEVGQVAINDEAKEDILEGDALLPGPDRAFIIEHEDRLGYDVDHTDAADPFRWAKVRDVVDEGTATFTGSGCSTISSTR